MGNILNRSKATAFRVEVLEKLSGVRDTVNRKSLLHHVVSRCTRSSLVGELIFLTWFWEGAWSCSPTLATCCWSWRTSAWSPALTMRSFWPTSAEWRCFFTHSQLFWQTQGGVPVITGLPSPLPLLLFRHTSSYNFLPRGASQFANVSTHLTFYLHKTTTCSQEIYFQNITHANQLSFCLHCFPYPRHTCTLAHLYRKQSGICYLSGRQFDS